MFPKKAHGPTSSSDSNLQTRLLRCLLPKMDIQWLRLPNTDALVEESGSYLMRLHLL